MRHGLSALVLVLALALAAPALALVTGHAPGAAPTPAEFQAFEQSLIGTVVFPGNATYANVSVNWNKYYNPSTPTFVVQALAVSDVVYTQRFCNAYGLRVVPRGSGHCYGDWVQCPADSNCVLLDMTGLSAVIVDADAMSATVQAGARVNDVVQQARAVGLYFPPGSDVGICVAGYVQGGGLSINHQLYGAAVDHITAFELVTTAGELVTATATTNADLFWALRGGGGGNWGTLTSFVTALHPQPDAVVGGGLQFPLNATAQVVAVWNALQLAADAPREAQFFLLLTAAGPVMFGFFWGAVADGWAYVAPFLAVPGVVNGLVAGDWWPTYQAVADNPTVRTYEALAGGFHGMPALSPAFVDTVLQLLATIPYGEPNVMFVCEAISGAVHDVAPDATAFPHRTHAGHVIVEVRWQDPAHTQAMLQWRDQAQAAIAPFLNGRLYVNYGRESSFGPGGWSDAYYADNYARLLAVKKAWDPDMLMTHSQGVGQPTA